MNDKIPKIIIPNNKILNVHSLELRFLILSDEQIYYKIDLHMCNDLKIFLHLGVIEPIR